MVPAPAPSRSAATSNTGFTSSICASSWPRTLASDAFREVLPTDDATWGRQSARRGSGPPSTLRLAPTGSDGGASGDDYGGAELAPDLGRDVSAEEAREEPVVVVAEDDHVGPGVARRVDDRPARLACSPHEVGL
jgi:hypothetical protein